MTQSPRPRCLSFEFDGESVENEPRPSSVLRLADCSRAGQGRLICRHKLQRVGVFWIEGSGKHLQVGELLVHRGPALGSHLP